MSSRKVRVKKLTVKTLLPVLREDQIDASEYESLLTESQIATGVDQTEENVSSFHHHIRATATSDITCTVTWRLLARASISYHGIYRVLHTYLPISACMAFCLYL